ncbi:9092_t:CDS:2, partial [Cetraspora pellucida]
MIKLINTKTIKNCWLHIRIISLHDNDKTPISFLTFVDNNKAINKYLSIDPNDARELQQVINMLSATELEQVEDEVVISSLAKKEQLNILYSILKIVNKRINDSGITIKSLYKLQFCIYKEVQKEVTERQ